MNNRRLRIAISGVGNRALPKNPQNSNWLGWIELIGKSSGFQLVAAHDPSEAALNRIVERGCLEASQTFQHLDRMLGEVACDALLVTNPAEFHAATIRKAIGHNLHVLVEKPFVTNLAAGRELVALIDRTGLTAAVIQNWRSKDAATALFEAVQTGRIGKIGHVFFRYVRDRENPNLPPYIFEEKFPLLYAMGIHHLDLLRYVLQDEFVSVTGNSFKPAWSLYESDTGLNLFLKTKKGTAVIYSGTISSRNSVIPQESLLIEGENGTLMNDSQWCEPPVWLCPKGQKEKLDLTEKVGPTTIPQQYDRADAVLLENFHKAVTRGEKLICPARDGMRSVAALEASRLSCETGKTVLLDEGF